MNSGIKKALDEANGNSECRPFDAQAEIKILAKLIKGHALALEAFLEINGHIQKKLEALEKETARLAHNDGSHHAAIEGLLELAKLDGEMIVSISRRVSALEPQTDTRDEDDIRAETIRRQSREE